VRRGEGRATPRRCLYKALQSPTSLHIKPSGSRVSLGLDPVDMPYPTYPTSPKVQFYKAGGNCLCGG